MGWCSTYRPTATARASAGRRLVVYPIMMFLLAVALMNGGPVGGPEEAILHGFTVGEDTVRIAVTDCGCTGDDGLIFDVKNLPRATREITVIRLVPDLCEVPPMLVEYEYSRQELRLQGGKRFVVTNEFRPFDPFSSDACGGRDQ
jgi:hypothetical protein